MLCNIIVNDNFPSTVVTVPNFTVFLKTTLLNHQLISVSELFSLAHSSSSYFTFL